MATSSITTPIVIPSTMRAVVQTAPGKSTVETVPVPPIESGTALVKILTSLVQANLSEIYRATLPYYSLPYPIIPGSFSIGRVAGLAADAAVLKEGDMVMVSTLLSARDDPSVSVVWGVTQGWREEAKKLYKATALKGHFAEFVRAPLENIFKLDEARLFGSPSSPARGLGYHPGDLTVLAAAAIAYAGLRGIDVKPGERVVVTPATGHYSMAVVDVAVAIGARVVAASRNADKLAKIRATYSSESVPQGIETVQLTGDVEKDAAAMRAFGPVDAAVEVSPPVATGSSNFAAAIASLRQGGRVSLIGGRADETLPVSYVQLLVNSLRIQGSYMYTREDVQAVIRLTEAGLLRFGKRAGHVVEGVFGLDQLEEAIARATEKQGPGCIVYIQP
jgi:D-arabinose 1-dehydrogenase-like Zn-dependent alcohol dehydrogenase